MCEPTTIMAVAAVIGAVTGGASLYQSNEQMKEAGHQQRQADSDKAADKAKLDAERRKIEKDSTAGMAKQLAAKKAARGGYGRRDTLLTGTGGGFSSGAKTLLGQ